MELFSFQVQNKFRFLWSSGRDELNVAQHFPDGVLENPSKSVLHHDTLSKSCVDLHDPDPSGPDTRMNLFNGFQGDGAPPNRVFVSNRVSHFDPPTTTRFAGISNDGNPVWGRQEAHTKAQNPLGSPMGSRGKASISWMQILRCRCHPEGENIQRSLVLDPLRDPKKVPKKWSLAVHEEKLVREISIAICEGFVGGGFGLVGSWLLLTQPTDSAFLISLASTTAVCICLNFLKISRIRVFEKKAAAILLSESAATVSQSAGASPSAVAKVDQSIKVNNAEGIPPGRTAESMHLSGYAADDASSVAFQPCIPNPTFGSDIPPNEEREFFVPMKAAAPEPHLKNVRALRTPAIVLESCELSSDGVVVLENSEQLERSILDIELQRRRICVDVTTELFTSLAAVIQTPVFFAYQEFFFENPIFPWVPSTTNQGLLEESRLYRLNTRVIAWRIAAMILSKVLLVAITIFRGRTFIDWREVHLGVQFRLIGVTKCLHQAAMYGYVLSICLLNLLSPAIELKKWLQKWLHFFVVFFFFLLSCRYTATMMTFIAALNQPWRVC
jgi:hypothetical protein